MNATDPGDSRRLSPSPVVMKSPIPISIGLGDGLEPDDPNQLSLVHSFSKLHGRKAVLMALSANLIVGSIKLFAGVVGRQSAMISEAIHSFADSINSAFLLIGLQKGSRAPDKSHPFGYGLETTLWAMLASLFMLLLGAWSIYLGTTRLVTPVEYELFAVSALVLIMSVILEIGAVYMAATAVLAEQGIEETVPWKTILKAFVHIRHVVSPTTRFVFYEDTLALTGAVVALIAITLSEFGYHFGLIPEIYKHFPDAIASIIIGVMIVGLGVYLFMHNSRGLTGSSAGVQVEKQIRQYVISLHGIADVLDLKTADYGMSGVVVHLRLEVDPHIAVKDVDDLTDYVRERLQSKFKTIKEVIIEVVAHEWDQEWRKQFQKLVDYGVKTEVLKPSEEQMLVNVYEFTQRRVYDIMIPRTDVDCLEVEATLDDLLNMILETGHTRIPIYKEDLDDVIGIIDLKTAMEANRQADTPLDLGPLVKKVDVYPENKPISDLLEEFKRKKTKMAIVVDEHGGFAGIVTLEDLLEEIVGEIFDPDDVEEEWLEHPVPNELVVSGRYDVETLNERFGFNIPDEDFKTLGGFVFGQLGQEPKVDDQIAFEDLTLTVLAMEGHRINAVRVARPEPLEDRWQAQNGKEVVPAETALAAEAPVPHEDTLH